MTPDNLEQKTDAELSELFAVEVAGWQHRLATVDNPIERDGMRLPNFFGPSVKAWWHHDQPGVFGYPPRFATSADQVLPWLEKIDLAGYVDLNLNPFTKEWKVCLTNGSQHIATSKGLARAACIALIRVQRHRASSLPATP